MEKLEEKLLNIGDMVRVTWQGQDFVSSIKGIQFGMNQVVYYQLANKQYVPAAAVCKYYA